MSDNFVGTHAFVEIYTTGSFTPTKFAGFTKELSPKPLTDKRYLCRRFRKGYIVITAYSKKELGETN